ncbi:MFS transporter [Pseudomonas sp. SWRI74]|jgi:MFS family permease|uniref:MFS transporter n=1 Tax=Pseudomonas azerbaijanoccidentalis TaxID=2842347 RepID=A0ABS6QSX4_9PSED|nr:MFS transporter [Pseudomonas azerbaijanoccidentalis]MBV4522022.1 MFS transporter [Pseudomonas azerbaijanoccidentalis]
MANARRNIVLLLLMFVIMLSIMDKTIFAFAGPQIIDELHLSPSTFGLIGSAFYCLYSISGVLVGFLANRVPSRWILLGMALVWMASQAVTGLSQTLVGLILGRLLLGAGTGPATAITQHACFKWFDARNRVVPSTLVQVSIMLGALLGGISLPLAVDHIGWRGAYLALGAASVVWMIAWLLFGAEGQQGMSAPTQRPEETRYRKLLLDRTYVWVTVVGFLGYLPNALAYSWIPVYMQKGHGLTPLQNGYLALGATTFVLLVNVAASVLARWAGRRGASLQTTMIRVPMIAALLAGGAYLLLALEHGDRTLTIAIYCVGCALVNVVPTFTNAVVGHIAPPQKRGAMLAIHIGLVTSAGILAPWIVGQLIAAQGGDIARGFETAIAAFGVAIMIAACLALRFVRLDPKAAAPAPSAAHNGAETVTS